MRTLKDIEVENKKVIVRLDFNVPIKDEKILDNNRIVKSLKTINYLLDKNAKIILMSHLGKIKTEEDKTSLSLYVVKEELERLLNRPVKFSKELMGDVLEKEINSLKSGEIILLENTRHMDYPNKLESSCDEELSKYWASLGEVFVLDAFGSSHRKHASTVGISYYLDSCIGFLIEEEIDALNKIKNQNKALILGGAKVSDKLGVIKNLINKSSVVLIGGAMCGTFLKSQNIEVGKTFVEEELLEECRELLKTEKIVLPVDVVTEDGLKPVNKITREETILDIGPETLKIFTLKLNQTDLILINGTMGKYEEKKYENGTKDLFEYFKRMNHKVVVCGGDTGSASKKFNYIPYYLSTGGGASLEYLEGKTLPGLEMSGGIDENNNFKS